MAVGCLAVFSLLRLARVLMLVTCATLRWRWPRIPDTTRFRNPKSLVGSPEVWGVWIAAQLVGFLICLWIVMDFVERFDPKVCNKKFDLNAKWIQQLAGTANVYGVFHTGIHWKLFRPEIFALYFTNFMAIIKLARWPCLIAPWR